MMSSFPLVSFLITLMLAAAVCTHGNELVKDANGNPVYVSETYFIQPINNGGGLVPAAITKLPFCPLGITQTIIPYQLNFEGVPVSFEYSYDPQGAIVKTESFVNIEFMSDDWPVCNDFSKLWAVDDSPSKEPAIIIAGKQSTRDSGFKIEKAGQGKGPNIYKLTTLNGMGAVGAKPGDCSSARPQLVLTKDDAKTLHVKFNRTTTAITSTSRVEKLGLRMFPFY